MEDVIVNIHDEYDGFRLLIGDKSWFFQDGESITPLIDFFEELGIEATYEEVY